MLGRQFGIMLTYINISHFSGFHRTTRLHARWQSCGHRTLGMSQMGQTLRSQSSPTAQFVRC